MIAQLSCNRNNLSRIYKMKPVLRRCKVNCPSLKTVRKLYPAMKVLVVLFFIGVVYGDDTYTTKYDGIDLDEILANERLLNGYVKCLLETGPCTPDGKELKKNIPDAMQNDCAKCSEKQRHGSDQVMEYIIDHRPDDWTKLETKYHSDGSYKSKYEEKKKAAERKEVSKDEETTGNTVEDVQPNV